MATKLDSRLARLRERRSDPRSGFYFRNELLEKAEQQFDSPKKAKEYVSSSMAEMDARYTEKTFEECQRVQDQIAEACKTTGMAAVFRHQGSVTNNTHIRTHSDIDLLVICDRFFTVKAPVSVTSPYKGDPMSDLRELRSIIESRLESSFPQAKVDCSGSKAVSISGGSLARKIDVISSNWYDTEAYRQNYDEDFRGVQILDTTPPGDRVVNFPFLHNLELNKKDEKTYGGLKRLIRFVKSARYDADQDPGISSYDIASLCFNLPNQDFLLSMGNDLALVERFLQFCHLVHTNQAVRDSLFVPNKTRQIFCETGASVDTLRALMDEVAAILVHAGQARGLVL